MKFEQKVEFAKDLAKRIKSLGEQFEVNLDEEGGYIEFDGITVNLDEEMNVINTEIKL
ncbi:hypothetical protein [Oceanimonas smirnovii]|uniref:hypothetical protein n=1 Tax=Oceanimonas smirnovii TaxID=264574 RepID=UPI003FD159B5